MAAMISNGTNIHVYIHCLHCLHQSKYAMHQLAIKASVTAVKKIIHFNNFLEEARALRWLFCSNITKYQERIPGNCHCVHTRPISVFSRAARESFNYHSVQQAHDNVTQR